MEMLVLLDVGGPGFQGAFASLPWPIDPLENYVTDPACCCGSGLAVGASMNLGGGIGC